MRSKGRVVFAFTATLGSTTCVATAQISVPTVAIGNLNNPADPATGGEFGAVAYAYNIGRTEVTNAQYASFLNAVAQTDSNGLYSTGMASVWGGISRTGAPGSYVYSTIAGRENFPVNYVNFWDACRFANWLHNGQGNGDTENGAYTLTEDSIAVNGVVRNAGWRWAVPSENEWYKAAFHHPEGQGGDADSYWNYPTSSNATPTTSQANFFSPTNRPVAVGSYAANHYGVFDLCGNVREWNDTQIFFTNRGLRGGGFTGDGPENFRAGARLVSFHRDADNGTGFRVVSSEPESCPADIDDGTGTGTTDGAVTIDDLVFFLTSFEIGNVAADLDSDGDPTAGTPDGAVTIEDLIFFLIRFEQGC